ncbi:hypothetical protein, conserved [Leishmania donovani]|uniref:Calponin-homology (CH) domain-containing protein n=2 Tax=Leishmania donovani TaxID=5661 RepID=E9BUA6_LEIDO|nr:hypothetical protein, conserved [Leishmania donovani]AYU83753.1 hypothetical protein LdCL_360046800 [Leishmania donovani]CBZ38835.1 hypothetical protein, conserved [Leishmania donovani]
MRVMSESILLGKAELLAWAASVTGISPCDKYGDLKDGLIYLALTRQLFPGEIDNAIVRLQRRGTRDAAKNWSLLTSCLRRHGIPTHLCSQQAVERGHTRYCFNLLVLFYFLVRLARGHQFAVDFAQPVDPQLAAFLQSPESVLAVERRVDMGFSECSSSNVGVSAIDEEEAGGQADSGAPRSVTRLSSPPSVATAPTTATPAVPLRLPLRSTALSADTSSNHVAPPLRWMWAHEQSSARAFQDAGAWRAPSRCNNRGTEYSKHSPRGACDSTLVHGAARAPATSGGELVAATLPPPSSLLRPSPSTACAPHLYTQNQLLREELEHVKAVSQLLLTQQRGSEAAVEMRASATLHNQLAKAELDHLHAIRQLEVTLTAASVHDGGANAAPSPQQWAALAHRAEAAEATAVQLYREYHESQQVYDSTLQQLRQVFCSIADIAAATLSSMPSNSDSADAAAYEETVTAAMMAQLTGVPAMRKDAFCAQMRALLLTLSSLRSTNARLQMDAASVSPYRDSGDATRDCASSFSALHASSSLPLERESLKMACAEARNACHGANPVVQRALQRLTRLVDILSSALDAARQDRDRWERRCRRAETATAQADAASQGARAEGEAQWQQDLVAHTVASSTCIDELSRLSRERCVRAAQAHQESQSLCSQVQEVLAMVFSTAGTHEVQWASDELVALLGAYARERASNPAMEEALAEQAETIAALRADLRRQREARERAEAQLSDGERRRQVLERKGAARQAQLRSATEKLGTQRNDSQAHAATLHRALLEETSTTSSTALASTPLAKPSAAATRGTQEHIAASGAAPLTEASRHAESTPYRSTAHSLYSSPHLTGALRSPATPDDDMDNAEERRLIDHHHRFQSGLHKQHASPLPSPLASASLPSSRATTAEADVPRALSTERVAARAGLAAPTASPARSTRSSTDHPAAASAPPLLLSAAELERRKQAILRKYDAA